MEIQFILDHMNKNHVGDMEKLLGKFGQIKGVQGVHLKTATLEHIEIAYTLEGKDGALKIDYPAKVSDNEGIKNAIIALCTSISETTDFKGVQEDLEKFREGFSSVCIASLSPENEVICSYSALLFDEQNGHKQFYIYVSEVAEHFKSLKAHPENVEVMFLEDEASAKSPILRKRLRYRTKLHFVERGTEFDRVYDNFLNKHGKGRGLETIRHMQDFHLIKLEFLKGRFVKGFGQAYDVDAHGHISYVGAQGNPHSKGNPHGGHPHGHPHGANPHGGHSHGGHPHGGHPHGHGAHHPGGHPHA
ncbi:HugZ family heme oxygenase [Helicobacter felis]|uniref:HugZ family heme oxygenase n=1 Tax=Helicobacter felis TaxID=214 RepID=UPI000CEE0A87|nr:HugZ family heme oxygenase [Helicobacter felis]